MSNDPLDGLFPAESGAQENAPNPAPAATSPADSAPAPADGGTARDDKGRFAAKTPQAAPDAPQAAPQTPVQAKQPIDAEQFKGYLEEREKRQAAERRIAEFEARERERQEQARQNTPIPSVQTDPEAYAQYLAEQTQRIALGTRFETSETIAREKHGDEPVNAAMEWAMQRAQTSPQFAAEYLKQKHPIDWAVKQQKRDSLMSQLGDDPDEYVRRRYAELTGAPPTEPQPSPAASPQSAASAAKPQPTRSLASQPSAGGMQSIPTGPGQAFDSVIK